MTSFLIDRRETEIPLQQKDWRLGKKDFENVSLEMEGNSKGSTDNNSYSPMSMIYIYQMKSKMNQFPSDSRKSMHSILCHHISELILDRFSLSPFIKELE